MWSKAALALMVGLFAVNVYRAATQSITADEAFTYNNFVNRAAAEAVRYYDANNHVAHTLLMWISTSALGVSEFTVRLPALLGGALYLWMVLRLCGYAFANSWLMFLAAAVLTLNPFVLDYLSAARGYGLALGFLLLTLDQMAQYLHDERRVRLYAAGLASGLTVASNLAFAVPVAALAAAFFLLCPGKRHRLLDDFAIPAIVAAFVILVVPMSRASGGAYYYGAESIQQAVWSLAAASFAAPGEGLRPDAPWWMAAGALVLAGSAAFFALSLRRPKPPAGADAVLALAGGAMAFSLAALVTAHHAAGVPYPLDRTGIYWFPLMALAAFTVARRFRAARTALGIAAVLCLAQFLSLFRVEYYGSWRDDAGTRRLVAALCDRESGARRVRVTGSWQLEPGLEFYRRMHRLEWMEPIVRGPSGAPGDYRAFIPADAHLVENLGLKLVYRDPISGAVLAE